MKLLPYDSFTIQTQDSLSRVIYKLAIKIEPHQMIRWSSSHNHALYKGTISDTGFEIHRIIHHRNSGLPTIRGQFQSSAQGTTIRITLQLNPFVIAFLGFWYFTWYSIFIRAALSSAMSINIAIWFLGFPVLFLVAFWCAFWEEVYRSRRDLVEILLGRQINLDYLNDRIHILKAFQIGICILGTVFGLWQLKFSPSPPPEPIPLASTICIGTLTPSPDCRLSLLHSLSGHPQASTLAISTKHQILVSGGRDKALKIWDLETGQLRKTLQSDSGEIRSVAIAPDGQTLVSGSGDRMVRIWTIAENRPPLILAGHSDNVDFVKITSDGKTLISGSYGEVKLWDLATGQLKATLPNLPQWKFTLGPVAILGDEPNRFNLRSMSEDGKVAIFDFISGQVVAWDLTTNQQKFLLTEKFDSFAGSVLAANLSPDGKMAAIQYSNASKKFETRLKVWDLTTGKVISRGSLSLNNSTFMPLPSAMSNDRFFGSDRNQLKIWNLHTAELEAVLEVPFMIYFCMSPDGTILAGIVGHPDSQETQVQVFRR